MPPGREESLGKSFQRVKGEPKGGMGGDGRGRRGTKGAKGKCDTATGKGGKTRENLAKGPKEDQKGAWGRPKGPKGFPKGPKRDQKGNEGHWGGAK